jgi:hypothetical protein
MVVATLIKGGVEIVLVGKSTPPLIVRRTHMIVRRLQEYIYIDQDTVMRFVMQMQKEISLFYGGLIIAFCLLVAVNCRFFVKPLIALIFTSILFFYVEFDRSVPTLITDSNLSSVQTLVTIIGGLFLIHGFSSIPSPPKPKVLKPAAPVVDNSASSKKDKASGKAKESAVKGGSEKKAAEPLVQPKEKKGVSKISSTTASQSTNAEADWTWGTGGGGKRKNR